MTDKLALRQIIEIAAAALAGEGEEDEGGEMEGEGEEMEGPGEEAADEAEDVREKALQIRALRNGTQG